MPFSDEPRIKACGPVAVDKNEPWYIGARSRTNAVAEINAGIEAAFYLLYQSQCETPLVNPGKKVILRPDSTYVIGLIEHKFEPRENVLISRMLQHEALRGRNSLGERAFGSQGK